MYKEKVEIFVDGSIRKNGKEDAFGGIGVAGFIKDTCILRYAQLVKAATNNESEYAAVFQGIKMGDSLKRDYVIYSDSQLIVEQIKGNYQVTKQNLLQWYNRVIFSKEVSNFCKDVIWISREYNKEADKLAQQITKEAL